MNKESWEELKDIVFHSSAEVLWSSDMIVFDGKLVRGYKCILRMNTMEDAMNLQEDIRRDFDNGVKVRIAHIQGDIKIRINPVPAYVKTTMKKELSLVKNLNNIENFEHLMEEGAELIRQSDALINEIKTKLKPDMIYQKSIYRSNARSYKVSYFDLTAGSRSQANVGDVFISVGEDIKVVSAERTKPRKDRIDQRTGIEINGAYFTEISKIRER
ncbi:MAG: hypothetical protein K6A76_08220 [Oribacterium sp.]|nr:hypothetical protein [Oribacterium sp.]